MPKGLDFSQFVGWGFQCLIVSVAAWGVSELASVRKSVQDVSISVQELNVKMAVVVERDNTRGSEITEIKSRIKNLEDKRGRKPQQED